MIIIKHLDKVSDTRSHIKQVYPVIEVVFLVISAMLCGQNKWTDIKDFGEGNLDNPLYMVSAFEVDQVLVLTHRPCAGEGKEIAIRRMLDKLNITGCLLTADALHCQVETFQKSLRRVAIC